MLLLQASVDRVPLKWMAPESFQHRRYSLASDVWSFGVLLWELYSGGATPYTHLTGYMAIAAVCQGRRMSRPAACPPDVFIMMRSMWLADASMRPSMANLLDGFNGAWKPSAQQHPPCTALSITHTDVPSIPSSSRSSYVSFQSVDSHGSAFCRRGDEHAAGIGPIGLWANFTLNGIEAAAVVRSAGPGQFVVHRHSTDIEVLCLTYRGCSATEVVCIHHYQGRYSLHGTPHQSFGSIEDLVWHYKTSLLPGTNTMLTHPAPVPNCATRPSPFVGDFPDSSHRVDLIGNTVAADQWPLTGGAEASMYVSYMPAAGQDEDVRA